MRHFIGNAPADPADSRPIPVVDPSNGESFGSLARGTAPDIDLAVAAARAALGESFDGPWGRLSAAARGRLLQKLGQSVAAHADCRHLGVVGLDGGRVEPVIVRGDETWKVVR